jgi:phospholipid N-methyltransferase
MSEQRAGGAPEIKTTQERWWRTVSRRLRGVAAKGHYFSTWRARFGNADDSENSFAIFSNWVTAFHSGDRTYGAATPSVSDQDVRIARLNEVGSVSGARIVEIGPLEAGHTKQMLDLGASSVVAIESNPEAFLKCLLVKETLGLEGARFVFGDCNQVLSKYLANETRFDVCSAVGVLYHMLDPVQTIDLLTRIAPVVYVWTHVASDAKPTGEWTVVRDPAGHEYRGRFNHYGRLAHLGGIERSAVWLTKESLHDAFQRRGHEIHWIEDSEHPHGRQVLFVSKRVRPA